MQTRRHTRVSELLKRELSAILQRELPVAEAGLLTISEVLLSPDLRHATVYVTLFGNPDHQQRGWNLLRQNQSRIQNQLAHAVILKNTPRLRFLRDESIARGSRVLAILDQIEEQLDEPPPPPAPAPPDRS